MTTPVTVTAESLSTVTFFAELGYDDRLAVARACRGRRHAAGELIISRHADDDDVYFVLSGRVGARIYSAGGREVAFTELGPGDAFGEMAAIDGFPRSADVEAKEPSIVISMSNAAFREARRSYPVVADAIMRELSGLVRRLMDRVVEFSTLAVSNRIHAELLRRAKAASRDGRTAEITPAPTHAELAAHVSTHREAVTREFKSLEQAGVIEVRRGVYIRVLDLERLDQLVSMVRGE